MCISKARAIISSANKVLPFVPCCAKSVPKHVQVTRHVCARACYVWTSANGNQVLLCSAKTGWLLHRQLGVSRSGLTSSTGPLTSNTLLMADKLIGLGQTGQQTAMFTSAATASRGISMRLRPFIQHPGQLFSWDVERKWVSGLWEGNKMSDPWLVKAAAH